MSSAALSIPPSSRDAVAVSHLQGTDVRLAPAEGSTPKILQLHISPLPKVDSPAPAAEAHADVLPHPVLFGKKPAPEESLSPSANATHTRIHLPVLEDENQDLTSWSAGSTRRFAFLSLGVVALVAVALLSMGISAAPSTPAPAPIAELPNATTNPAVAPQPRVSAPIKAASTVSTPVLPPQMFAPQKAVAAPTTPSKQAVEELLAILKQ